MYKGRLYYEDEDNYIDVRRFIEKDDSIGLNLITTWDDSGRFTLDATALLDGSSFTTGEVFASNQAGIRSPIASVISIKITERTETEMMVIGNWREDGVSYKFSGELERVL